MKILGQQYDPLIPLVIGTQTASTNIFTGSAPFKELKHGQSIRYWLPYNGTSDGNYLKLTLSDGSESDTIAIFYKGTTQLTTHYTAGSLILLTYLEDVDVNGTLRTGWWCASDYYSDTKSTTNSSNTSSKIFLVGATSQGTNQTTYSHDTAYVDTNGHLYSNSKQVVNLSDTQALTNKTYNGYTLGAACEKGVDSTVTSGSANLVTSGAVHTAITNASGGDYTLPQATSSALGGVKIGYTASGQNYPVKLNSSGQMYVNVPWTDTNTTYDLSKYLPLTGGTISGALTCSSTLNVSGTATMGRIDASNEYLTGSLYVGGKSSSTDKKAGIAFGSSGTIHVQATGSKSPCLKFYHGEVSSPQAKLVTNANGDLNFTGGVMKLNSNQVYGAKILYNNSTGTTGTVTLAESAVNFSMIEIIVGYSDIYGVQSIKIYSPNGKVTDLSAGVPGSATTANISRTRCTISGTSITQAYNTKTSMGSSSSNWNSTSNPLYIKTVIGYR